MVPPPIRTTWELSPEWVQQLGKHHSVALRDAIIALKRDDSAFRQQVLEVGESRNERDRDTWIDWVFNFHDLCAAGEDTVKSQLVAQRTHEAYLSTLADLELWAVHQYGGVKHHVGAAQGGGGSLAVRLRDVLHWLMGASTLTCMGTVKASQWTTADTFLGTKAQPHRVNNSMQLC